LLIPLSISFENIFEINDDFCLYAQLLKIENPKEFMIFNEYGKILGISGDIYKAIFLQYDTSIH